MTYIDNMGNRRYFIKQLLTLIKCSVFAKVALFFPTRSQANWSILAFRSKTLDSAIFNLFEQNAITDSDRIQLILPVEAQDGAVVPITITSAIEQIDTITILVEKNPVPLLTNVVLTPNIEAFFKTRIRMAESDYVTVIVKANNKLFRARKFVEVAIGGC